MSGPYEFRVEGHLDHHWATVLDGFCLHHDPDGTTTLTGTVLDQSHLHGLLARLRDLGAPLLSFQTVATLATDKVRPTSNGPTMKATTTPPACTNEGH